MKLSNSIKLSIANFSLFWKILIYKTIAFGICVLLFLPVSNIMGRCLAETNFVTSFASCFTSFQTINSLTNNVFNCLTSFFVALGLLIKTNAICFVYLLILIIFIAPFIFKLSDIPASETTFSYMSSLNKNSFVVSFFEEFNKSAGYSALKTLIEIPFWLIFVAGFYGILSLCNTNVELSILAPLMLFVFVILLISLKTTFFSGWVSSIVVFNLCAGKGLKKGVIAVNRKFSSILSSFAVITIFLIAFLYVFGFYAIIAIIPIASLLVNVFGQVLYFESQGMNYYISPDIIIKPRKLEEADNIKKVKNII